MTLILNHLCNGHRFLLAASVISSVFLASCASSTIDDAVPVVVVNAVPEAAPRNTGQYTNINIVPTGETAQLTDAETQATRASLLAQGEAQQQQGESAEAYLARLKKLQKLGSTNAAAVLKQIESGQ